MPAISEIGNDAIIVASINNHKITMLIIPPTINLLAKKTYDQRALAESCIQNKTKAIDTPGSGQCRNQPRNPSPPEFTRKKRGGMKTALG